MHAVGQQRVLGGTAARLDFACAKPFGERVKRNNTPTIEYPLSVSGASAGENRCSHCSARLAATRIDHSRELFGPAPACTAGSASRMIRIDGGDIACASHTMSRLWRAVWPQWIRRIESPRRYGRTPNISPHVPTALECDRLRLIDALRATVPPELEPPFSEEWAIEIERRIADLDAGTAQTIPWSVIREEAMSRIGHGKSN
jgi:putative addiction module component (TIGR02574 family)